MKTSQKILLLLFLSWVSNAVLAQISDEIKEISKKCEAVMNNPKGTEIDMDIKVLMITMHARVFSKGEKSFMTSSAKMLGKNITMETGFDGTQEWEYNTANDSLIIKKTTKKSEKEDDLDFDLTSKYKTAKMKEKDGCYEITFTNPINKKDEPGKAVMLINKSNYHLSKMQMGSGMKSITIKINKVKIGNVSDDIFVLDVKKYPTAKIARR